MMSEPTGDTLRVLVIDDNRDAADSLVILLGVWGYAARAAYRGPDGLAAAAEFRPQVIFLDLAMPGLDGYACARALRRQADQYGVLIVALTGYADRPHWL